MYHVTLIPGDGVGPEITEATKMCLEATGVKFDWDIQECGIEVIEKEGKLKKLVNEVEHVTFSGPRGVAQGQDITYVTERCVMKLTPEGILLTEIAPGVDLQAHILDQSEFPLIVSPDLKVMDARLFTDAPIGLTLSQKPARQLAEANHG